MFINAIPFVNLDYQLPPEQLVINLINNDNGTRFKPNELVFGIPTLVQSGRHNSKVTVSPAVGSYFTGKATLRYNRVDIAELAIGKSVVFGLEDEVTLSDIIEAINNRFGIRLTSVDYINSTLPIIGNIPNEQIDIDLIMAESSLIFINKLTLKIEKAGQLILSVILHNPILNGLFYTKPPLHALINY